MSNIDVTNPGVVNVADQGDGLTLINETILVGPSTNPGPLATGLAAAPGLGPINPNQPVTVSPSTNSGGLTEGGDLAPGVGPISPNQPVTVTPSMTAQDTIEGGTASPVSPNTENIITNNVVGQVYGIGNPTNVYI